MCIPINMLKYTPDQTGFNTGRKARDNSNRAIQIIHWAHAHDDHPPCPLLLTNTKKVFDRVAWLYSWVVPNRLGSNGLQHFMIPQRHGSRPTEPSLDCSRYGTGWDNGIFVLTLEPLPQAFHFHGWCLVCDWPINFPSLKAKLQGFHHLSNFKIR